MPFDSVSHCHFSMMTASDRLGSSTLVLSMVLGIVVQVRADSIPLTGHGQATVFDFLRDDVLHDDTNVRAPWVREIGNCSGARSY